MVSEEESEDLGWRKWGLCRETNPTIGLFNKQHNVAEEQKNQNHLTHRDGRTEHFDILSLMKKSLGFWSFFLNFYLFFFRKGINSAW